MSIRAWRRHRERALHLHRIELQGALNVGSAGLLQDDGVAAHRVEDAAAAEQAAERPVGGEGAVDGGRRQAPQQVAMGGNLQATLATELGKRIGQRLRGNVEVEDLGEPPRRVAWAGSAPERARRPCRGLLPVPIRSPSSSNACASLRSRTAHDGDRRRINSPRSRHDDTPAGFQFFLEESSVAGDDDQPRRDLVQRRALGTRHGA